MNIYFDVYKQKLPWDEYKTPVFTDDIIDEIKDKCKSNGVEFELISKLIIDVSSKKYYTHSSVITKSFDRIINEGWLHYDNIKRGLENAD